MVSSSQALKTLHELQQKLQAVQEDLARGPRQINAKKLAVEKRTAELENRRQKLKQLKLAADQKNLQLKTNETKIAELRAKLNLAASNREYEIITGQIDADTMANSVLEDEILEALTKIDQSQAEVKQGELDVAVVEADLKKLTANVQAVEPGLTERARALEAEVANAEQVLPADFVPQYRRAVKAYGADALAAVVNRNCTSCNIQITMQKIVELGSGKLMFCTCGRLLYLPDKG
jgi:predicted  nucleic acid-binding Zn-ribbon protein